MKSRAVVAAILWTWWFLGSGNLSRHSIAAAEAPPTTVSPPFHRPLPPSTVRIGKKVFTITLVPVIHYPETDQDYDGWTCDESAVETGDCSKEDLWKIFILQGLPLEREQHAVIHEVFHGILGTEKSNRKTTYHILITIESPWVIKVFHDNPQLLPYLGAKE